MDDAGDAFAGGVEAFSRGKERTACPYPAEDARSRFWFEGYDAAKIADDLHVDGMP